MDEPDEIEARALALTGAPLGCAFFQGLGWTGLSAAEAAVPDVSFHVLARALGDVSFWRVDHAAAVRDVMAEGSRLEFLARAILAQSTAAWWFAPLARRNQLWAEGRPGEAPRSPMAPDGLPTGWERYAQKPAWGLYTSTEFGGLSSYVVGASEKAGDLGPLEFPVARYRLVATADARVFEVDSPAAWRRLCVAYPAPAEGGLKGSLVVPDFAAVARDWDAVHLGLGGLLAADQVRLEGPEGSTELQGWDCEQTVWLRWVFAEVERLPDLPAPPPAPFR